MKTNLIALIAGILFGLGLVISDMVNPLRVIHFLDIGGDWDPTLLFVMMSALAFTTPAFHYLLKRDCPVIGEKFYLPENKRIEKKLIIGAGLFGLGWGLAGFCPGPAITALATFSPDVLLFVAAMLTGFIIGKYLNIKI